LQEQGVQVGDLATVTNDCLLNRLFGLELHLQQFVSDSLSDFGMFERRARDEHQNLLEFARNRCTNPRLSVTLEQVQRLAYRHPLYEFSVRYEAVRVEPPPDGAIIRAIGRKPCWVSGQQAHFADGSSEEVTQQDLVDMPLSTLALWHRSCHRQHQSLCHRLRGMPTRYVIATERPLDIWEHSMKRILRIPACSEFPSGGVGLLIRIRV